MTTAAGPILDELTCRALADRVYRLTGLALGAFNRMIEVELREGRTIRHKEASAYYRRCLRRLGQAMTDVVGLPGQKDGKRKFRKAA